MQGCHQGRGAPTRDKGDKGAKGHDDVSKQHGCHTTSAFDSNLLQAHSAEVKPVEAALFDLVVAAQHLVHHLWRSVS